MPPITLKTASPHFPDQSTDYKAQADEEQTLKQRPEKPVRGTFHPSGPRVLISIELNVPDYFSSLALSRHPTLEKYFGSILGDFIPFTLFQ
ncbi:MAG TPA: hypothetical protein VKP67_25355 [Xanthobacteraceae bacterium]|nr:hypothetical protein [Xanthobacteraceae bacterium]